MKKIYLILCMTMSFGIFAQNEIVNIPDANFKKALISDGVDTNNDGKIQVSEAESVTSLGVGYSSIKNLIGIEAFVNLTKLRCSYNQLTSLDLSKNVNLTMLECSYNQLTSLDVSNNVKLTNLDCSVNQLTSLDVSNNVNLTMLGCSYNQLTSLDVSNNVNLTMLGCSYNQLTSLGVSKNLRDLHCSNNELTSLDVSMLQSLDSLVLFNNPNLKCLSYLPNSLKTIDISSTAIECVANIPTGIQSQLKNFPICNATNNVYSCMVVPHIVGNVYVDANLNQEKEVSENGYSNVKLTLSTSSDNSIFYTDEAGNYEIGVKDIGAYKLTIETPTYFDVVPTEINGQFSSFSAIDTHFIALQKNENIKDLVVKISSFSRARPGFDMVYWIDYSNVGTETMNDVVLEVELPTSFILNNDASMFEVNDTTLKYKIGTLSPGKNGKIVIIGKTALQTLGLKASASASIYDATNLSDDETPENNGHVVEYVITGSYDPNDKLTVETITPKQVQEGIVLDYRIRFQNTGSDTAFIVVVTDTLSPLFDLSTLKITSSSHLMTSTLDKNVLVMTFKNILLPDSTTDELGSHGYIFYQIQPLKTLKIGDEIKNTANIYFDFNEPIITNTIITTVKEPVSTQIISATFTNVLVYPNPAKDFVDISTSVQKESIKITNIMGIEQEVIFNSDKIAVGHLPAGIYYLQFMTTNNEFIRTQIMIQE